MKILGLIIFFAAIPLIGLVASPILGLFALVGWMLASPLGRCLAKYLVKKDATHDELSQDDVTELTRDFTVHALMGIPSGAALFAAACLVHSWFGTNALLLLILVAVFAPFLDFHGSVTAIPVMLGMYWFLT